ncbi:hypothetical protein V1477_010884 [Vespula maculifrons]|uniref:Uncharacterized protein n=1 Tax=Vespula maculifrons TaxID=7453 RepID=A0ABD2C3R8_VESMC
MISKNSNFISNVLALKINPAFETRHRFRSSLLHKTCKSYIRTLLRITDISLLSLMNI